MNQIFRLYFTCLITLLFTSYNYCLSQCFTVGTAGTGTTTSPGDWTVGGNWTSSPGCGITGENEEYEVRDDMTLQDTSCSGGNLSMTAKTSLQVVNNSTLIIEGNLQLNGEEICIYVEVGSTLKVLGNTTFSKNKITLIVDGTMEVTGNFGCSGDCSGQTVFPLFNGSGTYSAVNGCVNFAGTQCSDVLTVLPIELVYFNASVKKDIVELEWSTISEKGNDFFTLEKSYDGVNFKVIDYVNGAGNSNEKIDYSIKDYLIHNGLSYYRLSQTDYDGQSETFDLVAVNHQRSGPIIAYPNPAGSKLNLLLADGDKAEFYIRNSFNKSFPITYSVNTDYVEFDTSQLQQGIYFLTTIFGSESHTIKVLIE